MTFIERKIDVRIALNGNTFDGSNDTLLLQGLRCQATVENYSGGLGSFGSIMQLRVNGMRGDDMAKLSTMGFSSGTGYKMNAIELFAGDDASGMALIFSGAIYAGSVDYNAMPDVGVDFVAHAVFNEKMTAVAASSYKGDMDVAVMLQGLAHAAGWAFENAGVTAKLSNHACGGSIVDQIEDICLAAGIHHDVKAGPTKTLVIWPAGGARDNTVITLSPDTGLVGYPEYAMNSVMVTSVFNPNIEFGRRVQVVSSVPNFSAKSQREFGGRKEPPGEGESFYCWNVTHSLSSQIPDGPWFTRAQLGDDKFSAR